jgi:hypothetical protein
MMGAQHNDWQVQEECAKLPVQGRNVQAQSLVIASEMRQR